MYLKDDFIAITLGPLRINSFITPKPYFTTDPDGLSGWTDGVGTKRHNTPRPVSWGDFSEPAYKSARLITITGIAVANTPRELQLMRDDLMGVLQHGYEEIKIATNPGPGLSPDQYARYAIVGIEGTPRWIQQTDISATWKIELYAPDPRIYGIQKSSVLNETAISGGIDLPIDYPIVFEGATSANNETILNNGNTDSWPTFTVTGDYYLGFEITNGNSKKIRYEGIVTQNAPVTIDMLRGTATQNGTDCTNQLTRRDWFSIPPNSSMQPMFYPIQDAFGWCDILYRDTWI